MNALRAALLLCCATVASSALPAAQLASAADQYSQEGATPVAPPPAPLILPKTVWPRIELADGRVLEKARANGVDSLTVTFLHAGGIAKVDRRLLPPELAAVFPFDAAAASREAREQAAARSASAQAEARREERTARRAKTAAAVRSSTIVSPAPAPAAPDTGAITSAVRLRASRYFEDEKRTGSGATLVFGVRSELDDPEAVSGWDNRWEVKGVASYKVYDSIGWGSFSSRTRKFRALIDAPPGKTPKVVSFDER